MTDSHIYSVAQIRAFLKVDSGIRFKAVSREEKYKWIDDTLTKFNYLRIKKKNKGIIRKYVVKLTGLSHSQLTRIINKKKRLGKIYCDSTKRHKFPKKYNPTDIALLIKTDNAHKRLSGQATKTILKREYQIFNKSEYFNISQISSSHIYNLRETRQYQSHSITLKKTNSVKVLIGERRKPESFGKPGYLRVDTVHQGDYEKRKGIYHINIIDEATQWELVGAVEKISEIYLEPLLNDLIEQIPFKIINFHSDNGSEFINKTVSRLLNKLFIKQTKSRARHCNDNALAECKNGAVIRKHMGYIHIPSNLAKSVNQFYQQYLNTYLNFHRPCGFPTVIRDKKGKEKKIYKLENYQTPYEKLKSLKDAEQYLRPNFSFAKLDKIAYAESDNDFAEKMKKFREKLFNNLKHIPREMIEFTSFISCSYDD